MKFTKFVLAALLTASTSSAQPSFPDSAVGHQFSAWLDVNNRGDAQSLGSYLKENYPSTKFPLQGFIGFRRVTGGFDLVSIDDSGPTTLVATAKARTWDNFFRVTFEVEAQPPNRITRLQAVPIPRPNSIPFPVRLPEGDAFGVLRAKLDGLAAEDQFSGAVMISKHGKPLLSAAYGYADRARKVPNTIETKFSIASMGKMFTAVAIAQLTQAGKLALNKPFGQYLADYPNNTAASKVTIAQLLTHTAGTGDIFGPEYDAHHKELCELKDYISLYGTRNLEFEPGAKFSYSNYGYIILGRIVEVVTGQSYYDYVEQHIFEPAGMSSTDFLPEDSKFPGRAIGYTGPPGGELKPNTDTLGCRGSPAGGGYSTVGDLVRFSDALTMHRLLDRQYTELFTSGKVQESPGQLYAYGFDDITEGKVRSVGHGGSAEGMNGSLMIFPTSGYVVVALSNFDPPNAINAVGFVGRRIPAQ
jgi:D-alanyl-D-alanine carboxypeptidase